MNTSLSALLLRENESGWRSGTFKNYKQLMESSQRLRRENHNGGGGKSESKSSKKRGKGEKKTKNNRIQLRHRQVGISGIPTCASTDKRHTHRDERNKLEKAVYRSNISCT